MRMQPLRFRKDTLTLLTTKKNELDHVTLWKVTCYSNFLLVSLLFSLRLTLMPLQEMPDSSSLTRLKFDALMVDAGKVAESTLEQLTGVRAQLNARK